MERFSQEGKASNTLEDAEQNKAGAKQSEAATESATFDFTEKSWSSDFVLNVEGTKLYVAKTILSLASPVFFRMFQSDFKESGASEMELPGKRKRDVIEFLGCVYPNTLSEISRDTALRILPLAEEYQFLQLKQRCEKVLLDNINTASSVEEMCQLLGQACLYNLKRLREMCMQLTLERPEEQLEDARRKYPLPLEATYEILQKRNAKIKVEIENLKASYGKINDENESLKDYIAVELKKDSPEMIQGMNWKETVIVLTLQTDNLHLATKESLGIWGKALSVTAFSKMFGKTPFLHLEINVEEKKPIFCMIVTRCFLVRRQRNSSNTSFSYTAKFNNKCQKLEYDPKRISDIRTFEQGFVRDGKLGLILQIFMSEPTQC